MAGRERGWVYMYVELARGASCTCLQRADPRQNSVARQERDRGARRGRLRPAGRRGAAPWPRPSRARGLRACRRCAPPRMRGDLRAADAGAVHRAVHADLAAAGGGGGGGGRKVWGVLWVSDLFSGAGGSQGGVPSGRRVSSNRCCARRGAAEPLTWEGRRTVRGQTTPQKRMRRRGGRVAGRRKLQLCVIGRRRRTFDR
jgi:hypothetical protein